MKEWFYIKKFGQLYIEEELVWGNELIFFTCIDIDNNRYLVMAYESYQDDYIFVKVDSNILINMLENKITMEEVFRQSEWIYETYCKDDEVYTYKYASDVFPSNMLPLYGAYFELKGEWLDNYISKLKNEELV